MDGRGGLRRIIGDAAARAARGCTRRAPSRSSSRSRAASRRAAAAAWCSRGATARTWRASARSRARTGARALPSVALAPGGTVCTVARNLGMSGEREGLCATHRARGLRRDGALRGAADAASRRRERRRSRRVRLRGGARRAILRGVLRGAAAGARHGRAQWWRASSRDRSRARRHARGMLGPTRCSLRVDGDAQAAREWSLVLASVVRDVGLHLLVPYRAGEEFERFHVVASGLPPRALGAQLRASARGTPAEGRASDRRARPHAPPRLRRRSGRLRPRRRSVSRSRGADRAGAGPLSTESLKTGSLKRRARGNSGSPPRRFETFRGELRSGTRSSAPARDSSPPSSNP